MAKRMGQYERQALLSVALAAVAVVFALALLGAVATAYDPEVRGIKFAQNSKRYYVIMLTAVLACASSAIGALIAFNSAGQKSNPRSGLSWLGFFANSGAFTLAACIFVVFFFLKVAVR